MNRRLLALLSVVGGLTIGGTAYLLARTEPGVTRADLLDAGITEACAPVRVACQVRDLCQSTRPDGGLSRRYRAIRSLAYECPTAEGPVLIQRWPRQGGRDCFEPTHPGACLVVGPDVDDGGTSVAADTDLCTCRARGRLCRMVDGGAVAFDRTYDPGMGPFVGAGCEPTPCTEMDGEQGQAIAEACR